MNVTALELARTDLGLTVFELWLAYFALGGLRTAADLGRYLAVGGPSTDTDDDTIVHALNEAYDDRDDERPLRYSHA